MREYLFRGKRKDNGAWVEGYLAAHDLICPSYPEDTLNVTGEYFGQTPYVGFVEVDPETVGPFTGLRDKNSKRIFEGDVCRNTKTGEIVSVKWHGTMAGFVWSKQQEDSYLFAFGELFRAHDKYEIIGNIHDNPELMEVQHV